MQLRAAGAGLSDLGSQELAVGRTEKVVAWRVLPPAPYHSRTSAKARDPTVSEGLKRLNSNRHALQDWRSDGWRIASRHPVGFSADSEDATAGDHPSD